MPPPSAGERHFVDRLGLFFEMLGAPRTMGRIYGWLMICEPVHQSITEIAGSLAVSKASISTLIRQLEASQVVERVPVAGTRQHHYQVTDGGWAQIIRRRSRFAHFAIEAADAGLKAIGSRRPEQRERLEDMRDMFLFMEDDADEFVRRFEDFKKRRHDGGETRPVRRTATAGSARLTPRARPGHGAPRRPS